MIEGDELDNPVDLDSAKMENYHFENKNENEAKGNYELTPDIKNEVHKPHKSGCCSWEYWQIYFDIFIGCIFWIYPFFFTQNYFILVRC